MEFLQPWGLPFRRRVDCPERNCNALSAVSARLAERYRARADAALRHAAEIAAHPHKHVDEVAAFLIGEAGIGLIENLVARFPHLVEKRLRSFCEEKLLRAAVIRVWMALHHAQCDQLVDQPCHRDWLHLEKVSKPHLVKPLMARKLRKRAPLRLCEPTDALRESRLHEAGIVTEQKACAAVGILCAACVGSHRVSRRLMCKPSNKQGLLYLSAVT